MNVRTRMGFRAIGTLALAAVAVASLLATSAVAAPGSTATLAASGGSAALEPWECPGAKRLTVWFWPTGHKLPGGIRGDDRATHLEVYAGRKVNIPSLIATVYAERSRAFGLGMQGALCGPKGRLGKLVPATTARVSAKATLRCTFPGNPLFVLDRQSANRTRLRVVLPPGKVVLIADMKNKKGSALRYAKAHCKREASPRKDIG